MWISIVKKSFKDPALSPKYYTVPLEFNWANPEKNRGKEVVGGLSEWNLEFPVFD